MAAQSTLFSMQAEGSLVDTPQGSSLECLSTTTRGVGGGGGGGVLGVRVLAATEQAGLVAIRGDGGNGQ